MLLALWTVLTLHLGSIPPLYDDGKVYGQVTSVSLASIWRFDSSNELEHVLDKTRSIEGF